MLVPIQGNTVAHAAAVSGRMEVLEELRGFIDNNIANNAGERVIHVASKHAHWGCVEDLIQDDESGLQLTDKKGVSVSQTLSGLIFIYVF